MSRSPSFDAAVRHLFRHLHDPRALRKNPFVRRFFEDPSIDGLGRVRERAILDRIHDVVRRGAQYCRDIDIEAGDEQALSRYAIVSQCLERRSIRSVADELGLSARQLYRRRVEICRRVASYIMTLDDAPVSSYFPEIDEFRLLIDCTRRCVSYGAIREAFDRCEGLVTAASTPLQRIEAFYLSALTAIRFENVERAEAAYHAAQAVYQEHVTTSRAALLHVAQAYIDLIRCELAVYRAHQTGALHMAERAVSHLERVVPNAPAHVRELYAESCASLASALWNFGDLEKAYDYICAAETSMRDVRHASAQTAVSITIVLWKFRNDLLLSSKSWYPFEQRVGGLEATFERAYTSGGMLEAVVALVALCECHANARYAAQALRYARSAILLANHLDEPVREQISIQLAGILAPTPYCNEGFALLPKALNTGVTSAFIGAHRSYVPALRAFHLRRFHEAWRLAGMEDDSWNFPMPRLRKRILAAACAQELRQYRQARQLIEAVIPQAEQLGSVRVLRDAYCAAAKIVVDAGIQSQADELTKLLIA